MSHLTPGGGSALPRAHPPPGLQGPPAARTARLGLGVPGYAHPLVAPVEWAELTRPSIPLHWAVLNVANGPGDRPDPHCLDAAGRLTNARLRVLGHLDLAYGGRPAAEIVADARRFLGWYRVGGFYLGRCPAGRAELPWVRRTTTALEALLDRAPDSARDGGYIVLGHGIHPHPGYLDAADQSVTFSGPWTDYRWSQAPAWTAEYPPERFVHLVHGVPRGHLDEALRVARWQGAGTIFFTDSLPGRTDVPVGIGLPDPMGLPGRTGENTPFETLPGFWDEFVSRLGLCVLE
ncbi:spherulation-specific family 4 protein [Streptomyces sp. NPDC059255]|uniref:spherulation-specific family 4 protein n=1 Tax=Streptomyces sp. NPDC059255 TaxID=3346793 RepID=UPI0036C2466A